MFTYVHSKVRFFRISAGASGISRFAGLGHLLETLWQGFRKDPNGHAISRPGRFKLEELGDFSGLDLFNTFGCSKESCG